MVVPMLNADREKLNHEGKVGKTAEINMRMKLEENVITVAVLIDFDSTIQIC